MFLSLAIGEANFKYADAIAPSIIPRVPAKIPTTNANCLTILTLSLGQFRLQPFALRDLFDR